MRVVKEVEFDKDEIEEATKEVLLTHASQKIGKPNVDEEYEVELCSWRSSATVRIVSKKHTTAEQGSEQPATQL